MATWTQERKDEAIAQYLASNPTPDTSIEIIKEIAEAMEESSNGVRMILQTAGVYVKKPSTTSATTKESGEKTTGNGPKRVSKESSLAALTKALTDAGMEADSEIIDKLTGKSAVYFADVITKLSATK